MTSHSSLFLFLWREVICDYQNHFHLPISDRGAVGKEEEEEDADRRRGVAL